MDILEPACHPPRFFFGGEQDQRRRERYEYARRRGKSRCESGTNGAPTDPSCESLEEAQTIEVTRVEVEGDEFQVGELSGVFGSVCAWRQIP